MSNNLNLSLIAAVSANGMGIGSNNQLLCHITEDLKRFKKLTLGHTVVMGRNTFDSLPKKPLPKRRNIVLTHDENFNYEVSQDATDKLEIAHSIDELLKMVEGEDEVFVIGGGQIYQTLLPFANKLYITWLYGEFDADTFFPKIDTNVWRIDTQSPISICEDGDIPYAFYNYVKRQ